MEQTKVKAYKYSLSNIEKGACRDCGRYSVSFYVDNKTGKPIDPKVGKCGAPGCRYHYSPRQFFIDKSRAEKLNKQ